MKKEENTNSPSKEELESLSTEELEELAYHNIPIENLLKIANPLGCWVELDSHITKEEVLDCIKKKDYEIVETPLWSGISRDSDPETLRYNHVRKIAYFVVNEPIKPIRIDIGIPDFGYDIYSHHIIDDGNHRLSGDYIAGKTHVKGRILGCENYAKELGLYNPNAYEIELNKRYNQEFLEVQKEKMDNFINQLNENKRKKRNGSYEILVNINDIRKFDDILINYIDKKETLTEKEKFFENLKLEDVKSDNLLPKAKITLNHKEATLLFGKNFDRKNKLRK